MNTLVKRYTPLEEVFNSITHGIGGFLGIAALVIMLVTASHYGGPEAIVSAAIFGTSLIFAYTSSTLYHAFPWPRVKFVFRNLDHAGIFFLIAGTYTPLNLVALQGGWGWSFFGIVWGVALSGIVLQIFHMEKRFLRTLSYLVLGWMGLFIVGPLFEKLSAGGIAWLCIGGGMYTLGALIYLLAKKHKFSHAIWHLFVLAGSISHFFMIELYVLPYAKQFSLS